LEFGSNRGLWREYAVKESRMQRKPHIGFLLIAAIAPLVVAGGCDKLRARDKLNKGVEAYKAGQYDAAIEDFKDAKDLDPNLTNAQIYLATAYASQYIPGAPSPENIRNGDEALKEYKVILDQDPNNLSAIDGIGSILYNMAGTPYDSGRLQESKTYHQKHIALDSSAPEPYYWIGVIDWTLAYHTNRDAREEYNKTAKKTLKENDPLPAKQAADLATQNGMTVDEGMTALKKAIEIKPDYDDAMAYLNLLYRQKADLESTPDARADDLKQADDLVDQVKAIKQKRMLGNAPTS
jgi:tetratricopeptide (TPR) repeat protein